MPTIEEIQTQVTAQVEELQGKALELVKSVQAPVVVYVGKAATAVAELLPEERPEALANAIEAFNGSFAKTVLDTEVAFAKDVIDAVVQPFAPKAPAKKAPAVKAA